MEITEASIQHTMTILRLRNSELEFQRIPMEAETRLMNLVRQGKYQDIHLAKFDKMKENLGAMAQSELTQYTYMAVASIALCSRAAIDGGALSDDVFDLSDALLMVLSHCKTLEEINTVYQLAPVMFAKQVDAQSQMESSLTVERIQNYIGRNIFKKITLDDIADYIELSPNYLSNLFSSKMKISIHQYIQREKIKTACNLLAHTSRPISDIALYMGFQTQSNFAAVFKKWQGVTPTEYRAKNYREVY